MSNKTLFEFYIIHMNIMKDPVQYGGKSKKTFEIMTRGVNPPHLKYTKIQNVKITTK